ncbi:hypothetical protein [Nostocoides vanveenii]|uniref:Uncharacterized protein n=1 Tax=Nostocoides vanveenii TaxID=330835 RepID=A0ABP4X3P9_9MICO
MSIRFRQYGEPRPLAFIATGAVLGIVVGVLIYLLNPDNGDYSARTAFGYLAVFCGLLGGLLGGVVASVLSYRR